MRPFEIVLIVLLLLFALRIGLRLLPAANWLTLGLLAGLGIAVGLHLALEGGRWQMVPLYVLAGAALLLGLLSLRAAAHPLPGWPGWLLLGLTALLGLLPAAFPVPSLPAPGGPYPVGTASFYWVDEGRLDPYSGQPRRLMVQVWYPAGDVSGLERSRYLERLDVGGPVLAEQFNMPSFAFSHIDLARTNAYLNAPLAEIDGALPVLVFSHGWTGMRVQNTFQVEELASRGYVVFAPDHAYGAALTVYPDGTVTLNNPDALPSGVSDEEYDRAARILGQAWVGDLRFVLDQAERLNAGQLESVLTGRLDLERVGAFGHSTGGGAAAELCFTDTRCKAALVMDPWYIPFDRQVAADGLRVPYFIMQSDGWGSKRNLPLAAAAYQNSLPQAWRMTIAGTQHYDFSDIPLLTPLAPLLKLKGPLAAARTTEIINSYSVEFFNQVFQGQAAPLLQGSSPDYPEVTFQ